MTCSTCGGSGRIALFSSTVDCDCRRAPAVPIEQSVNVTFDEGDFEEEITSFVPVRDGRLVHEEAKEISRVRRKVEHNQNDLDLIADRVPSKWDEIAQLTRDYYTKPCPFEFKSEYLGTFPSLEDDPVMKDIERVRAFVHGHSGIQQAFERLIGHIEF